MASSQTPAFATATANGYTVKTTSNSSAMTNNTDSLVTPAINANSDTIENKKIIMGMTVATAFNDAAADLKIQGSHNGTDWADLVTLSSDITPNVEETKPFLANLSDIYTPYFRFIFNSGNLDVNKNGVASFFYAYK